MTLANGDLKDIEYCITDEGKRCVLNVLANMTNNDICHKSCSIMQYSGKIVYEENYGEDYEQEIFAFSYKFAPPRVTKTYEEYLTYDVLGTMYLVHVA